MTKRPFFGLTKPKLKYPVIENFEPIGVTDIPLPKHVTLIFNRTDVRSDDLLVRAGARVRTGQRLKLTEGRQGHIISTATGTVAGVSEYRGYHGKTFPTISIHAEEEDQWDDELTKSGKEPAVENVRRYLACLPGVADFARLTNESLPIDTIVVNGIDEDLLTAKNQFTVKANLGDFTTGIQYLRKMMPGKRIVVAVFPGTLQEAEKTGAEVKVIKPEYPNALPKIIMKNVLGLVVPTGKRCEDLGVVFVNAESVVSLAQAFKSGRLPVDKLLALIHKDGARKFVRARIGTSVRHILDTVGIETREGDRVLLGGPMAGQTLSSGDTPISSDTHAIMVQDRSQIVWSSDTHCFNCGECVRACPADIPVNMLVRVLENGLYEEAVAEYDLLSCVECGLCSYVCVARIPIFQYIMLGKYEIDRTKIAEGSNG